MRRLRGQDLGQPGPLQLVGRTARDGLRPLDDIGHLDLVRHGRFPDLYGKLRGVPDGWHPRVRPERLDAHHDCLIQRVSLDVCRVDGVGRVGEPDDAELGRHGEADAISFA